MAKTPEIQIAKVRSDCECPFSDFKVINFFKSESFFDNFG